MTASTNLSPDIEANRSPTPLSSIHRILSLLRRTSRPSPRALHPTSYLDGIRGLAALAVYFHHHQAWFHDDGTNDTAIIESSFGRDGQFHLATLPGVRLAFTGGSFAVALFFVVSGYVLSLRPLQAVHAGDSAKLAETVASALFRRWLRLYIPVIAVTLVFLTLWYVPGTGMEKLILAGTWAAEMHAWALEFADFSYIFQRAGDTWWFSYGYYMWTIPFEFQGSIVVYASLLAFSQFRRDARLCCQAGLMLYFLCVVDGWHCAMFLAGGLLCDLNLLAESKNLPDVISKAKMAGIAKPFFYMLLILGIYLGGVPNVKDGVSLRKNPGWHYLSYLKPPAMNNIQSLSLFLSGVCFVACVAHLPLLKRFFETRFCQYLGRVSFGLYLVHGPVLWTLGDALFLVGKPDLHVQHEAGWTPPPRRWPLGLEMELLAPQIVLVPVTFFLADMVARFVDEPSVRLSRWLYKWMMGKDGQMARRPV